MLAATTKDNKRNKLKLAEKVANTAGHGDLYPLSEDIILDVAACFKGASYSSGYAYLAEMKLRHIELGFATPPWMLRLLGKCRTSIERGMGVQQAAATFSFVALARARAEGDSQSARSLIISTWWLLRELEASNVRIHITHVRKTSKGMILNLPVSKTDTRGIGAERCLPCLCGQKAGKELGAMDSWSCPACTLKAQLEESLTAHGVNQHNEVALACPLFFRAPGEALSKVETIAAWRKCPGVQTENEDDKEITGHSARRTGIQLMARTGWARWQIQFMARHTTSVVDRYIEEAWAGATADWAKEAACSSAANEESAGAMKAALEDLEGKMAALEDRIIGPGPQVNEVKENMKKERRSGTLILSDKNLIHVIPTGSQRGAKALWKTPCGWFYERLGNYEKVGSYEKGEPCLRCLGYA